MEEINNVVAKSLDRYFQLLSHTGYVRPIQVDNLLVLSAIQYLVNNFGLFITDEDLQSMVNVLYCIGGDCIIQLPNVPSDNSLFHNIKRETTIRLTEKGSTRTSEDNLFRINS